jgi:TetR/AcrR family transcriptional regulator, cholesterol catabolism regulator
VSVSTETSTEGKPPGRNSGSGDSEDLISRVACRIFRERGYHATPMRAIASAMGVQPAALYYWYSSKEELLFSIMDRAVEELTIRVRAAIDPEAGAADQLRQAITAHITAIADHLDELTVFLHETKSLDSRRREVIQAKSVRYEHIFRDILHTGIASGEFIPVDARLARFFILSGCNWLYNWYKPGGPYRPDQIAQTFGDMILHGLLP